MENIYKPRNEYSFIYSSLLILLFVFLFISFIPDNSYAFNKRWVPLTYSKDGSKESEDGTPPDINIIHCDNNYTEFEIIINGFYIEDVMGPDNQIYQRIEVPDYATTNDIGFPELPSIRGLLGISDNTTNVEMNVIDITEITVIGEFNIWPHQEPIYLYDEEWQFEKNEEFYSSDEWFPFEQSEVGDPGIFKYYTVDNVGYVPFRYNPYLRELKVNPTITLRVDYTGGGAIPIATMDEDMANLFRYNIWNFDELNPNIDNYSSVYYLILTPDEYYENVQDFVNGFFNLIYPNYHIDIIKIYSNQNTPGDIKLIIMDYYENHHSTDYVLLIGDGSDNWYTDGNIVFYKYKVKQAVNPRPDYTASDYWYTLLTFNKNNEFDPFPDVAIGRISFNNVEELNFQFYKEINYYNSTYNNNVLLVAHQENSDKIKFYIEADNIKDYQYYHFPKPIFHKCYGVEGANNEDVRREIDAGVSSVCYLGHGLENCWENWTPDFPSYWTNNEIFSLNNINKPTVVFNYCCMNARINYENGNCLCEDWMIGGINRNVYTASVATFGHSYFSYFNDGENRAIFMEAIYKCIYGGEKNNPAAEKGLGWLINTANVNILRVYYPNSAFIQMVYEGILLGDPALRMRTGVSNKNTINTYINNKTHNLEKLKNIEIKVNNPVCNSIKMFINANKESNLNIDIYDISGRKLDNLYCGKLNIGENNIEINNINLKSGLYILNIYSEYFNEYRKVVVIR